MPMNVVRSFAFTTVLLVGVPEAGLRAQSPPEPWTLEEAVGEDAGRQLIFTLELPDTPEALFRRWTSEWEARRFLGEDVRIDPRPGGRYEVLFDPERDPAGALAGTYGSRIVSLEAPSRLVFQWNSPTPRIAARELGGRRVLQESLVEVRFDALPETPDATRLRVRHYDMGDGPDWDASYEFYRNRGWPWILDRLLALYGRS